MNYRVKKETYANKLIEDFGILSIEGIESLAEEYIGDVFKDEEDIKNDLKYIEENGEETWLCNNEIQISILRVGE